MITIYGASGHAKVINDIIIDQGKVIKSIIDDDENVSLFEGKKVFRSDCLTSEDKLIIAIGNNNIRKNISIKIASQIIDPLIHSTACVSDSVTIDSGTAIMPRAIINASTTIGKHCIINTGSIVEHDCFVDDYSHISPGSIITGGVTVGEGVHIGAGAIILPGIKIGAWSIIGAGSVILNDVLPNTVVVGNPGKKIR